MEIGLFVKWTMDRDWTSPSRALLKYELRIGDLEDLRQINGRISTRSMTTSSVRYLLSKRKEVIPESRLHYPRIKTDTPERGYPQLHTSAFKMN